MRGAGLRISGGSAFSFFGLLLRARAVIPITLLIIVLTNIGVIMETFSTGDPVPAIKQVGGQVFDYDDKLYLEATKIEAAGGLLVEDQQGNIILSEFIMTVGRVAINLWYLWTFGVIAYWISTFLVTQNTSLFSANVVIAILILSTLQLVFAFIVIDEQAEHEQLEMTTSEKIIPFNGLFKIIKVSPLFLERTTTSPDSVPVNESVTNDLDRILTLDVSGGGE